MKKRKAQVPKFFRDAEIRPDSLNEEKRTVDVVFTTGYRDLRRRFWSEDYYEELEVSEKAIRMERLNNKAPFLDLHNGWSNRSVIGVVERAWIENGIGIATIRFSRSEHAEEMFRDVIDGIRCNVSVGYRTHRYREEVRENEDIKTRIATDWEPYEISLVPMGFDPGAQVRSLSDSPQDEIYDIEIETARDVEPITGSEITMSRKAKDNQEAPANPSNGSEATSSKRSDTPANDDDGESASPDLEAVRKEAVAEDRRRAKEIQKMVRSVGLDESLSTRLIDENKTVEECRTIVIDALAEKDEVAETRSMGRIQPGSRDEILTKREGIQEALMHRWEPKDDLSEPAREFRGMSLIETARSCLELAGVSTRGMSRIELAGRALHTTSDFANILANVANNTLRQAYQQAPQTFLPLVRTTTTNDFKPISRTQLGEGTDLEEVLEDGEFTRGTIGDAKEEYSVLTYGKIFGVTRKCLVNDDMDAFTRVPMQLGRRAAEKESSLFWAIFTSNPAMNDTKTLFHADHGNLADSATAITIDSLGLARKAMRDQTGIDEGEAMNIMGKHLIVPSSIETVAEQFLSQNLLANSAGSVNPFAGKLQLIVEPRLDAASTTAWYMAADPAQIDIIERAYLEGETGIYLESREGWDVDGVEWKVRLDVGYAPIDWRGLYKNAGS